MLYKINSDYLRVSANVIDTSVDINEVYTIATTPNVFDSLENVEAFIRANKTRYDVGANVVFPMFDPYSGSFQSRFVAGQDNVMNVIGYITHTVTSVDTDNPAILTNYANVGQEYSYDVYILSINAANFANVIQMDT